ncbi:hypothetical protein FNV43_RR02054 [Rhamnella rubrinervis]|uniref:Uncharacterized protein n=1 Tax=Rhamnella rubrinervis TaxID=2594499 RepID=A0A8K0HQS3_9ROSA|nr:hypothetical protein FNV43_RR02054 [Rhamnella rubrinervis]
MRGVGLRGWMSHGCEEDKSTSRQKLQSNPVPQRAFQLEPIKDALVLSRGEEEEVLGKSTKNEAEKDHIEDVEPVEGTEPWEEKIVGHKEVTIDLIKSFVTINQLIAMRKEYDILFDISLRVPKRDEVPSQPFEGEIAITIPAFYCGLIMPFPALLRRFLQEAPLHPV